jgi:hypothetical protein
MNKINSVKYNLENQVKQLYKNKQQQKYNKQIFKRSKVI